MYVIIGWIAVEVAFHRSSQQADRTGALHTVSATPVGGMRDSADRFLLPFLWHDISTVLIEVQSHEDSQLGHEPRLF